jgi:hypothetical protein
MPIVKRSERGLFSPRIVSPNCKWRRRSCEEMGRSKLLDSVRSEIGRKPDSQPVRHLEWRTKLSQSTGHFTLCKLCWNRLCQQTCSPKRKHCPRETVTKTRNDQWMFEVDQPSAIFADILVTICEFADSTQISNFARQHGMPEGLALRPTSDWIHEHYIVRCVNHKSRPCQIIDEVGSAPRSPSSCHYRVYVEPSPLKVVGRLERLGHTPHCTKAF